jgi:hypothetical protein
LYFKKSVENNFIIKSVYKWPIQILGRKLGTRVCLEGKLFNSEEALGIGWVDGVAEDQSQLMTLCLNKMEDLVKIPGLQFGFNYDNSFLLIN